MPCTKCEDGKYKWGKTGECEYSSKEACESTNPKKYSKMKPTPLGKKTYEEYEKELKEFNLSKVERVELGFVDDIKPFLNKGETALKGMISAVNTSGPLFTRSKELRSAISNLNSDLGRMDEETRADISNGQDAIRGLDSRLDDIETAAKDLGINVKDVPGYNRAITLEKSLQKAIPQTIKVNKDITDAYIQSS
jgi:phosphomevalonate kinase